MRKNFVWGRQSTGTGRPGRAWSHSKPICRQSCVTRNLLEVTQPWQGGWSKWSPGVPSNPNNSGLLRERLCSKERNQRPAAFPRGSRSSPRGPPRVPPAPGPTWGARLGRAGQRRALSSAGRQRRPSRSPLGPPRAPIAPTPPARPRFRPPPPRGIPGARRRPRRLRGSQQTPLPEGERRPRRLTGKGGGRADCRSRRASGPTPGPAGHPGKRGRGLDPPGRGWRCRRPRAAWKLFPVGVHPWNGLRITELLAREETSRD